MAAFDHFGVLKDVLLGGSEGNGSVIGFYVKTVKTSRRPQKGRFGMHRVYFILSSSEWVLKVGFCTKPTERPFGP